MISDFRFQISDLPASNPGIGFRLSAFRSRRRGVSIVEVLFAILITTVGLFGAIAVFPFASAQARRSRIFDMMGTAGRAAFHDFDARGMRRPDMWVAWDHTPLAGGPGRFEPFLNLSNRQPNESFCIDPRFIAANTVPVGNAVLLPPAARTFPYQEPYNDANSNSSFDNGESTTSDLNGNGAHDPPFDAATRYPAVAPRSFNTAYMRRLTLRSSSNPLQLSYNAPMSLQQANAIFMIDDDLSYERSTEDKSRPANQMATALDPSLPLSQTNPWGRRQTDGNISWFATLVPKLDVSGLPSDEYILSIVMCHERASDLQTLDHLRERVVLGVWQGDGSTGGEIKLVAPSSSPQTQEQLKVRPGDWVMVSGSSIVPQLNQAITRFQWYRIADCDADAAEELNAQGTPTGNHEMYVTLMGQDWNMNFCSPTLPPLSNKVNVTIVQGAFAVYEKTVRLDYGSSF